jgi:hypothetical protein
MNKKHSAGEQAISATFDSNNKRRKSCTDMNITDFDNDLVRRIAIYLPKTSRALLAVALTVESSDWKKVEWTKLTTPSLLSLWGNKKMIQPSSGTKALILPSSKRHVGKEFYEIDIKYTETKTRHIRNKWRCYHHFYHNAWNEIDFGDLDPQLAGKLTDDDIAAVLACTDALHKLKTLILTGCTGIGGCGLRPICGSKVLQRLDMSLAFKSSTHYEPFLSKTIVMQVLESIVDSEQSSLKYIQFPKMWRDELFQSGQFDEFFSKYDQSGNRRNIRCAKCCNLCHEVLSSGSRVPNTHASQDSTCYNCLQNFCYECAVDEDLAIPQLAACQGCEKEFCHNCVEMICCDTCVEEELGFQTKNYCSWDCAKRFICNQCNNVLCGVWDGCGKIESCKGCNETACATCMSYIRCSYSSIQKPRCGEEHCGQCYGKENCTVSKCGQCYLEYCVNHRLEEVLPTWNDDWQVPLYYPLTIDRRPCCGCMEILAPKLIECYNCFEVIESLSTHLQLKMDGKTIMAIANRQSEPCKTCHNNPTFEALVKKCLSIKERFDWQDEIWQSEHCLTCLTRCLKQLAECYTKVHSN